MKKIHGLPLKSVGKVHSSFKKIKISLSWTKTFPMHGKFNFTRMKTLILELLHHWSFCCIIIMLNAKAQD